MQHQYDYIIAGAGCAGLSLLYYLLQEPLLQQKKILVIDKEEKNTNDRTWCFWEKSNGPFEPIVKHTWQQLQFKSEFVDKSFSIQPYTYKMIEGLAFYNYIKHVAKPFTNVTFLQDTIKGIVHTANGIEVITPKQVYTATYAFNAIPPAKPQLLNHTYWLLQHFTGWVIQTAEPVFNEQEALFMDFTISQQHGTSFMYVLPTAANKALIEYTLFTENLLEKEAYITALRYYIQQHFKITSFTIEHQEFGIIPMTNYRFKKFEGNIVNIGTAGGVVKASSGYAFQFIQKHSKAIVASLVKNNHPFVSNNFNHKKFALYDSVLLQVLQKNKMPGANIFSKLFAKNKPQTILSFLDNETTLLQDLQIMSSVPVSIFLPAAVKELVHSFKT